MTDFSWDLPYPSQRMPVLAANAVATSQPLAAQAGLAVLAAGGNAADAAIAAAATLTVVEPVSNGLGSDAFCLVHDGKALHGLNGSGRSPRAWRLEQYAGRDRVPELGWAPVTVPGAVAAWGDLHKRFGKLPFARLIEPAIRYARDGYLVSPVTAAAWAGAVERFKSCLGWAKAFAPNGRAPRPGELFRLPEMAETLEEIAATGGESFYRGPIAGRIADFARQTGGLMDEQDLAAHHSEWVQPIEVEYRGVKLHEIPPNGQGLAALIALGVLRHFELGRCGSDSPDSVHLQIEAMKIAFAEAHEHISEPAAMVMPPRHLLEESYLARRAAEISPSRAAKPSPSLPTDHGTVYLTAADSSGMMVSFIQSNYMGFGSGVVAPGGISLQNRGCGFNLRPGHPNCIGPSKRPYHTIIPSFITRGGKARASFGVMGGHMQPQGHVQMMVRMFDYHQNPQAASDAPRWHVTEDGRVMLEKGFDPAAAAELRRRGHDVTQNVPAGLFGGAQLIVRLADGYCAASDHRKDGQAVGF